MDMLESLQNFCTEHHITFFMAGGTLLGAVRHQGFIPWDDDVDLMIPRPDYERLIREFRHDRYRISACDTDCTYMTPFARMWDTTTKLVWEKSNERELGVFLDLFPIDGYPEDEKEAERYIETLRRKRMRISLKMTKYFRTDDPQFFRKCLIKLSMHKHANHYSRKYNEFVRRIRYEDSAFVGVTTTKVHIQKERNPKSIYQETVYLPFGRLMLPSIGGYDHYLKHLYGDYMELPPLRKRVTPHDFTVEEREEGEQA